MTRYRMRNLISAAIIILIMYISSCYVYMENNRRLLITVGKTRTDTIVKIDTIFINRADTTVLPDTNLIYNERK